MSKQKFLDHRNIENGMVIGEYRYSDQPYIIETEDGAWLCVMTAGNAAEGESGQTIISMRSTDCGRSWTDTFQIEPPDGAESSYAVLLKAGKRIYCFYNHNTDNIRSVPAAPGSWFPDGVCRRVDSLGHFVYKYSDDNGKTWSKDRYDIPVREFEIDRKNAHGGQVRYFWNVGKPFVIGNTVYVSLHKVGNFGDGFFTSTEGVLLVCNNIFSEPDPEKLVWETYPDGDKGIRPPENAGPIAEEHSYVTLSDGTIYCTFRTISGHPGTARSFDGGHTFTKSSFLRYGNGRLVKHPRAANFVWKCQNGKYLYWYHNHGGNWYEDRNPAWLCAGVEYETENGRDIKWSQGEIILYHEDYACVRMSYPDLIEKDGEYYVTETQKTTARLHKLDKNMLEKMWESAEGKRIETDFGQRQLKVGDSLALPPITVRDIQKPDLSASDTGNGFTFTFTIEKLQPGEILFSTYNMEEKGVEARVADDGRIHFKMGDSRTVCTWTSDSDMLSGNGDNISIIIDGGPKTISFVINGVLCDGGETRKFGYGRFNRYFRDASSKSALSVGENIKELYVTERALKTYEAAALYQRK